jgi:hypothetical protein
MSSRRRHFRSPDRRPSRTVFDWIALLMAISIIVGISVQTVHLHQHSGVVGAENQTSSQSFAR